MAKTGAARKRIPHLSARTFLVRGSTWVCFQLQSLPFLLLLLGLPLSYLNPSLSTCVVVTKQPGRVKERSGAGCSECNPVGWSHGSCPEDDPVPRP